MRSGVAEPEDPCGVPRSRTTRGPAPAAKPDPGKEGGGFQAGQVERDEAGRYSGFRAGVARVRPLSRGRGLAGTAPTKPPRPHRLGHG